MTIGELIQGLDFPCPIELEKVEITGLSYDSRTVGPGQLFVAIPGFKADGARFAQEALVKGAAAVVAEKALFLDDPRIISCPNARCALAILADRFYGHPSGKLKVVGITGTNGKTTTTYLIRSILKQAGERTGLIGTIRYLIGEESYIAPNTTPESLDLQRLLAGMVEERVSTVVMEVSSHGLALERVKGCEFKVAVFTNLTQDHLDFHPTMEDYLLAKLRLFEILEKGNIAVVNADDPIAERVIQAASKAGIITYGLSGRARVRAKAIFLSQKGTEFVVTWEEGQIPVKLKLPGKHNVYNALAAFGAGLALGFSNGLLVKGLESLEGVSGRFELVDEGQPFAVIVDYAHTPDALERLLSAVREITRGRVLCVFGCGGDRDRKKRPMMGRIATNMAGYTIITSDNPRTEDPEVIVKEIEEGVVPGSQYEIVLDRKAAIRRGMDLTREGDSVVIAGKGHEDYQILGTAKIHFDDREIVREALREKGWRR
jgi:UDP-N-acetylmuramoyl-L-alanyl-D-glutamate--2,6-diaminopimelate ligase